MKEKTLVRIQVPMADAAFDVRVPYDLPVATASEMVANMFKSISESKLPLSASPVLWYPKKGIALEGSRTIREYEITDSDLLLLV